MANYIYSITLRVSVCLMFMKKLMKLSGFLMDFSVTNYRLRHSHYLFSSLIYCKTVLRNWFSEIPYECQCQDGYVKDVNASAHPLYADYSPYKAEFETFVTFQ